MSHAVLTFLLAPSGSMPALIDWEVLVERGAVDPEIMEPRFEIVSTSELRVDAYSGDDYLNVRKENPKVL